MSDSDRLACVLIAADPAQAQAICDALRAARIDAWAVCSDEGAALEIFVPAKSASRARRLICEGNWPRLA